MDSYYIRIVVADDHPVVRLGIQAELNRSDRVHVVGSVSNSTELMQLISETACDMVVTDYAMPGGIYGDGIEFISHLRKQFPSLAIVVLTAMERPALIRTLIAYDVQTIVSKRDAGTHLVTAIKAAATGRRFYSPAITTLLSTQVASDPLASLSPRETEVLTLFVAGKTISDISRLLQRSKQTISSQKISAMTKLGVQNDAELFTYMAETRLLESTARLLEPPS